MSPTPKTNNPRQALASLRMIWGAALVGPIILLVIIRALAGPEPYDSTQADFFFYAAIGALAVFIPAGYFIRSEVYKAHWVGHAITPAGYTRGNIVLFAMTGLPTIVALAGMVIAHDTVRPLIALVLSVVILAFNFPTGKPMRESLPRLGDAR